MATKRKQPKASGRGNKDPFAPPQQFLVPADNRALLDRAAAMAKKTASARQAAVKAATAPVGRGRGAREPIPIRDRAAEWSQQTYEIRDEEEESSTSYSDEGEPAGVHTRDEYPDDHEVVDLAYIAKKKPPASIVRNFLRAQATSINEARSDDEFA